ncbi:MAG: Fe2+-dependent dioxygenase [Synechococcaceae cyanobacterium]
MRLILDSPLSSAEALHWRNQLLAADTSWDSGQRTAGWHARAVKRNRQLALDSPHYGPLTELVLARLQSDPLLQAAALPVAIHSLRVSRCGPGEGYGRHVDNAFMACGRSDLSFSLFLSDPSDYDGGALVLETPTGEESWRLPAGQAVLYPSTLLHRVEPVEQGERLVVVGWLQSRVREAAQRELLFELDTARRSLFQQQGKSEVFDLLCRCYANLLRQWGE